jgi:hypothetical protein
MDTTLPVDIALKCYNDILKVKPQHLKSKYPFVSMNNEEVIHTMKQIELVYQNLVRGEPTYKKNGKNGKDKKGSDKKDKNGKDKKGSDKKDKNGKDKNGKDKNGKDKKGSDKKDKNGKDKNGKDKKGSDKKTGGNESIIIFTM